MKDTTNKTDALACARELLRFIAASPASYQAVGALSSMLEEAGFHALREQDAWTLRTGEGLLYAARRFVADCVPYSRTARGRLRHHGQPQRFALL